MSEVLERTGNRAKKESSPSDHKRVYYTSNFIEDMTEAFTITAICHPNSCGTSFQLFLNAISLFFLY